MKSLVSLVFVLAFIGLAQPALMNTHRLRKGGFAEGGKVRNTPTLRIQEFLETIAILKAKWYQQFQKGLWWFLKTMTNNSEKNGRVRLSKKTIPPVSKNRM